jgi:hypothetical protein
VTLQSLTDTAVSTAQTHSETVWGFTRNALERLTSAGL